VLIKDEALVMFNTQRSIPALLIAIGLLATPACAAQRPYYGAQRDYREVERRAYDNGYRRGLENGQNDARDRRDFRIDRDRDFRNADAGYRGGWGDRDLYRRQFRDGYREGYAQGYNRVAQYDRRAYPNGPFGSVNPGNRFPGNGNPGNGPYASLAAQVGYRDGVEAGREAANDREASDPRRSKRYREGDHDYNDRYGSRDQYKQDYRAAFIQGYEEGYRGYRR
jgi:hypothetical protein